MHAGAGANLETSCSVTHTSHGRTTTVIPLQWLASLISHIDRD